MKWSGWQSAHAESVNVVQAGSQRWPERPKQQQRSTNTFSQENGFVSAEIHDPEPFCTLRLQGTALTLLEIRARQGVVSMLAGEAEPEQCPPQPGCGCGVEAVVADTSEPHFCSLPQVQGVPSEANSAAPNAGCFGSLCLGLQL